MKGLLRALIIPMYAQPIGSQEGFGEVWKSRRPVNQNLLLLAAFFLIYIIQTPSFAVTCTTDRDFFCPDASCIGTDPDCCDAGNPCQSGFYCDVQSKTCLTRSGQACSGPADCIGDSYCSPDAGLCTSKHFVFAKPITLRTAIGTKPILTVTVFDPANRTGTYSANVVGTGTYFARFFGTENTASFSLRPNEVKVIPLYFSAGAIGNYQLKIQVVDSKYGSTTLVNSYPKGIAGWSETANVEVTTETRAPTFVSAPGPSAPLMVGALGALAFFFLLI